MRICLAWVGFELNEFGFGQPWWARLRLRVITSNGIKLLYFRIILTRSEEIGQEMLLISRNNNGI